MERKFCYGCMRFRQESPVCELCGYDERQLNPVHQLPVGAVLNNQYIVGRYLGQGGFGITYIGWDRRLNTPVAIKEYFPSGIVHRNIHMGYEVSFYSREEEAMFASHRNRFLKEAQTLAKLANIPHIVQVKNFFVENNTAYIVMEFVEGITLKQFIRNQGKPLTVSQTLQILEPVMTALETVHGQNIIHRDVSPDNIMIQPNGSAKLIDFGTVRFLDDTLRSRSTDAVLKPGFAPMEQYNTRGNIGPWTDVYALSATICYCLTGKIPPDAPSRMEDGDKLPVLRSAKAVPQTVAQVLEQGMAMRVANRIATVGQLRHRLREAEAGRRKKKSPAAAAILAGVAAAAMVVALLIPRVLSAEEQAQPELSANPGQNGNLPQTSGQLQPGLLPTSGHSPMPAVQSRSFLSADAGLKHTVVLYSDGTVRAVGSNDYGQCDVEDWRDIIQISTLKNHTVGLRRDGSVVAVGDNQKGQCNVQDWTDIIAVSAGEHHTVGLRSDGTVVAVGTAVSGECDVSGWQDIVSVACGYTNTLGLCRDGTVVITGSYGKTKLHGWDQIRTLVVSDSHFVGIRHDGTVKAAGNNANGQCNLSGWKDIRSVALGTGYTVGLKEDGTVLVEGINDVGQHNARAWKDMAFIATGLEHTLGVRMDGTFAAVGANDRGQCDVSVFSD